MDFPGGSMVKNPPAKAGDTDSIPGSGRFTWRRKWQSIPVFFILVWKIPWTGKLACYSSQRVGHSLATKQQQHPEYSTSFV